MQEIKPNLGLRLAVFLFGSFRLDPLHYLVKCKEHGYQLARLHGYSTLSCVKCLDEALKKISEKK